uniref:peroxidase n=1 Tax=Solanum lycopersicum TaxID=4081 RepID=A0A3Q7FIL0_SOLLC
MNSSQNYYAGSHTIGKARCTSFKYTLDEKYAAQLRTKCPKFGGDQNLFFLDYVTPTKFDNNYLAKNNKIFFEQFVKSMVKLENNSPLMGHKGEIRKNCRKMN